MSNYDQVANNVNTTITGDINDGRIGDNVVTYHQPSVCPHCGRCPHCGQGRNYTPYVPWYPTYPNYPYWTITGGTVPNPTTIHYLN